MTTTTMMLRSVAATALAGAALGLAACGAEESPSTASGGSGAAGEGRGQNREVMLEYAQCMRDQGVEFPDPQQGEGGRMLLNAVEDVDPEKLRAAEEACGEILEKIEPPELSAEEQQEFKDAALAHARCMREHGIDFPDPQFSSDGAARIELGKGRIDPNDTEFREAQEACRNKLPGGGKLAEEAP